MELLDRYLAAVKSYLPKGQRHDVVAELSDAILSRLEEKQAELGRPLTVAEQESVIKEYGHPMLVAGRYLPRQHLIGPDLFPAYWYTLRAVLGVALVVCVCLVSVEVLTTGRLTQSIAHGTIRAAYWALLLVGSVTVTFAVMDSQRVKLTFLNEWNPASLPTVNEGLVISRAETIFGIVMMIALILWWVDVLKVPGTITGTNALGFRFSPAWQPFHMPILLLWLVELVRLAVDLVRPYWTPLRASLHLATNVLSLVVIYSLLRAGDLLVLADTGRAAQYERLLWLLNWVATWSLVGLGILCAVTSLQEVRRLMRRTQFRVLSLVW